MTYPLPERSVNCRSYRFWLWLFAFVTVTFGHHIGLQVRHRFRCRAFVVAWVGLGWQGWLGLAWADGLTGCPQALLSVFAAVAFGRHLRLQIRRGFGCRAFVVAWMGLGLALAGLDGRVDWLTG